MWKFFSSFKDRSIALDILRFIAGIMVVSIHVSDQFLNYEQLFGGSSWWLANIVNSFSRISVPLFVMISGYLVLENSRKYSVKEFLERRVGKLIVPFVFWSVIYIFYWYGQTIDFMKIVELYATGAIGHLYFIVLILGLYIITPYFWEFTQKASVSVQRYVLASSILFAVVLGFLTRFIPSTHYVANTLTMFLPYVGFYIAGWYYKYKKNISKNFFALFLLLGALNAMFNYLALSADKLGLKFLYADKIGQYFFDAWSPLIIIMTILFFRLGLQANIKKISDNQKLRNSVHSLAISTFGIYLLHPLVISFLDTYFHMNIESLVSPLWFWMLIKIVLTYVISAILVSILLRIPYLKKVVM